MPDNDSAPHDPFANPAGRQFIAQQRRMPRLLRALGGELPGRRLGIVPRDDAPVYPVNQNVPADAQSHPPQIDAQGMVHLQDPSGAEAAGRLMRKFFDMSLPK